MSKPFGIIYKATNLITGKCYIGQTTKILKKRILEHIKSIDNIYFHNALKVYGIDNFIWEILCECDNKLLLNIEETMKIIINHSYYTENGYNMTWGGDGQCKGYKHTEEAKKKMSFPGSSNPFYGKKHTEESKRKMKENGKGKGLHYIPTKETRNKISIIHKGKIVSEKTKKLISIKNRKHTNNIIQESIKLREIDKLSFEKISKVIKVPRTTIQDWFKKGIINNVR